MKLRQSICWSKDTLPWPLRTCFHLWHAFSLPPFLSVFLSVFSKLETKQHLFSLGTACTFSHQSFAIHSRCLQKTNWHPVIWEVCHKGHLSLKSSPFTAQCLATLFTAKPLYSLTFFCLFFFFFLIWYDTADNCWLETKLTKMLVAQNRTVIPCCSVLSPGGLTLWRPKDLHLAVTVNNMEKYSTLLEYSYC